MTTRAMSAGSHPAAASSSWATTTPTRGTATAWPSPSTSDPAFDTADFADSLPFNPGNLRVDYVLGGKAGLVPIDGSVFWPAQGTANFDLVGNFPFPSSDHRLVEMTFAVVEETAVGLRLWQDALFDGRGTASPTAQLRKQATDLSYTDATGMSVQHSAAADDSTGPALARFIEAYGDVAVSAVDFAGGGQVAGNNAITLDWGINGALLVRLDLAWNAIKAIAIDEYTGPSLRVENFVDVLVTLSGSEGQAVAVDGAKRGVITTGSGNDTVLVGVDSNERNWSNSFRIETGAGNDSITVATASRNYVGGAYDGRHTSTTIDAGAGSDSITGGAGADTIVLRAGEADGDSIANFSGAGGQGDTLQLIGFGTGASFSFAAGQLVITGAAGTESVTLAGVAALAAADVIFV